MVNHALRTDITEPGRSKGDSVPGHPARKALDSTPGAARLKIVLIGMNHKTAEVELRECLGFSHEEADAALQSFQDAPAIAEVVLISTCNRIEILMATPSPEAAVETAKTYLARSKALEVRRFEHALYILEGDDAVRHIFRVAASLDSMVVGEPQILGQIKEAYRSATLKKSSGVILNRLLHKTFFVAKRVRSETGIGDHAVSISYAAIELGRKIFGALEEKKVL
ncbi:MAG: glutamyl-tRNA reductase, partial [Thermodesulfobacteriota bacterium]